MDVLLPCARALGEGYGRNMVEVDIHTGDKGNMGMCIGGKREYREW